MVLAHENQARVVIRLDEAQPVMDVIASESGAMIDAEGHRRQFEEGQFRYAIGS